MPLFGKNGARAALMAQERVIESQNARLGEQSALLESQSRIIDSIQEELQAHRRNAAEMQKQLRAVDAGWGKRDTQLHAAAVALKTLHEDMEQSRDAIQQLATMPSGADPLISNSLSAINGQMSALTAAIDGFANANAPLNNMILAELSALRQDLKGQVLASERRETSSSKLAPAPTATVMPMIVPHLDLSATRPTGRLSAPLTNLAISSAAANATAGGGSLTNRSGRLTARSKRNKTNGNMVPAATEPMSGTASARPRLETSHEHFSATPVATRDVKPRLTPRVTQPSPRATLTVRV